MIRKYSVEDTSLVDGGQFLLVVRKLAKSREIPSQQVMGVRSHKAEN